MSVNVGRPAVKVALCVGAVAAAASLAVALSTLSKVFWGSLLISQVGWVRDDILLAHCYRLGKRLNCLAVGVTPRGSAVHMTRVSYMSRASVRGLAGGHRSSRSVLLGYPCLMSG